METGTFLQDKVQDYINNNFVAVKYNSGVDAEQFRRFDIMMTPTYVVLDSEGNELGRVIGHHNPDEFIEEIKKF